MLLKLSDAVFGMGYGKHVMSPEVTLARCWGTGAANRQGNCCKGYLSHPTYPDLVISSFAIAFSHTHLRSVPPNSVSLGLWQSICFRVLFRMRPSSDRISHSHMTTVFSFQSGQMIDFHSLSIFCFIGCRLPSMALTTSSSYFIDALLF